MASKRSIAALEKQIEAVRTGTWVRRWPSEPGQCCAVVRNSRGREVSLPREARNAAQVALERAFPNRRGCSIEFWNDFDPQTTKDRVLRVLRRALKVLKAGK